MNRVTIFLVVVFGLFAYSPAFARTVEPGSVWTGLELGLDSKMGGRVGGSDVLLTVGGDIEYALESRVGIYFRGTFGLGDTQAIKLQSGVRYRFTEVDLPISPYVSAHLGSGHLMDVMGANLWTIGAGLGAGLDYYLTRRFTAGLSLTFDFASTLGGRPAAYNTTAIVATSRYAF